MEKKSKIVIVIYISLATILGIIPIFLPPTISDFSYIDWNGKDLSKEIKENEDYLNETFTQFNGTNHLYYYSVMEASYAHKVAMVTLQGLVNKYNTSLFLEIASYDNFWFEKIVDYYSLAVTNLSSNEYWEVIDQFKTSIKGLVIYDEDLIDTVNVATFLASLEECVVITSDLKKNFTDLGITKIKYDLRDKFDNKVELYEWAWEKYGDKASKKGLFNLDTNKARTRDYAIASKCFTMWLTPGPFGDKEEIALFRRILDESPSNIPVWGWVPEGAAGEYEGVRTISHAEKYLLVSSWPNPTVYSAFHIPEFKQKTVNFSVDDFKIKNKIYLTFVVSDGDNFDYCMNKLREIWDDRSRGEVPVGLTIAPLLYKLNPAVLKYFYETATENDYFVCATSGLGYCNPDRNPAIAKFLSASKPLMDKCDMDQIWLNNGYEAFEPSFSDEILDVYTSKKMGLSAVYLNYHDFQVEHNKLINNVPVFYSLFVEQKDEVIGKLKSIELTNQHTKQPLFIYIAWNSWNFDYYQLSRLVDELDSDVYEVLRPDHFSEVFKKYEKDKDMLFDELFIFLIAGLIPLISVVSILAIIWLREKDKNRENGLIDESEELEGNAQNTIISEKMSKFLVNLLYLFADITLFFAIKVCLFTTNLFTIYFILLMVSVSLGVFLKKMLETQIGKKQSILFSGLLLSVGFLLFTIDFRMIMFFGIALGVLLAHQFQTQRYYFKSKSIGNRAFLYSTLLSLVVISLFPRELYDVFKWILSVSILVTISIMIKFRESLKFPQGQYDTNVKIPQYKSFILAYLFIFLFIPTIAQEKFYYHLIWGLEWLPTKLTLQYAIATTFILGIIILELLRIKNIEIDRKIKSLLFLICIASYIMIPFFLQGIFYFYLIHILLIFGVMLMIDEMFAHLPQFAHENNQSTSNNERTLKDSVKKYNFFVFGFLFWFMFLFVLIFTPPVTIVVDTYNLLEKAGIIGITELEWSPAFWTLFYIPSIYMFLALPITIFCLIYGVIITISTPAEV